ncbi:murein biosynthesis integral membrane protein MurJ [Rhizobacter sp. SG703]|uniref:murein biosynthesis integral membrane protein MurJ n=1 Tax=Rhizobacter sp. SG703 TaxID=2587140 RepID=UPI001446A13C|nr:murein biosynthesis integral membrane protein MurJ [Rhizobacter sp. SG703]NKI92996.1 putative peptidoglycan lipid II flippase [Rhizobacter sp. SG703]
MNLLRAASVVSLLTLASRITGLGRELMVAAMFGAGAWTDAFQAAFRIPNMLRRLFAEGAFAQAFVPILGETRTREGDEVTHLLVNAVATVLFWALLVTCAVGMVAAPAIVWLMASGLAQFDGAVVMTRWMFPYIGFISLVALAAGVLNTWKQFAVPAASPVLLNLAVIGAGWGLAPVFRRWGIEPIYAMAVGVMVGGVLQLAVQLPALARIGQLPRIGMTPARIAAAWHHPGVHRVLRQMAPALLGVSVAQLSLLINTQIASHVGVGAVSWLTYADRLMEFPTALLGVALGVVLIPQLSSAQARADAQAYSGLLDWGLRLVLLLALPCAVALLVFTTPLVASLYHRGAFRAEDVAQTVLALRGYGVGLMGLIGVKILAPGFYARQDIRTPVKIAVIVLVLTQLMNLLFVPQLGHAGLALSIGLGALVNAGWLFVGLRRAGSYTPSAGWAGFTWRVLLATTLLGALLGFASLKLDWIALGQQHGARVAWLAACLGGAAVVYFGTLLATGLNLRQFARRG